MENNFKGSYIHLVALSKLQHYLQVLLFNDYLCHGLDSYVSYKFSLLGFRKRVQGIRMHQKNVKKANLYAARKESIKLPNYDSDCGGNYHIREFLSHPSGIEAMLNTRALQSFESIETHTYRSLSFTLIASLLLLFSLGELYYKSSIWVWATP